MRKKVKFFVMTTGIFFSTMTMSSQSSWDIKYNSINDLDDSFINKQIFLDQKIDDSDIVKFKTTDEMNRLVNNLRVSEVELTILGKSKIFIEDYKIYDDMGSFDMQRYLNKENKNEFIKDIYLVKIVGDKICLKANLYTSKKDFTPIEFEVDKSKVKGFLTKM